MGFNFGVGKDLKKIAKSKDPKKELFDPTKVHKDTKKFFDGIGM